MSAQAMQPILPRLTLVALIAVLVTLVAAPAQGASRLVVRGAGFGHGIGMSQYGAFGFAERGSDHGEILRHYYSGTQIGRLESGGQVRVLLKTDSRIVFGSATRVAGGRKLDPTRRYVTTRGLSGAVVLRSSGGRSLGSYASPLSITGGADGVRVFGRSAHAAVDGRFRGNLQVRASSLGGVSAINALGIEDYIRGVVAGEMPSGWPQEALRAQAVAARTYALATSKNGDGFDQYADTRSQVYIGISGEVASTNAAVAATRGNVVAYQGTPIVTYYFSTSGGRTENVENSFIGAEPKPWLKSVADPHDNASPRHRWTKRMTLATAGRRLGSLVKGSLRQIKVLRRGRSPRVVRALIVGSGGTTEVTGPQLRSKLDLFDTWARFTVITASVARGDGNVPSTPAPAGGPGTGGAQPGGGAATALARAVPMIVAGAISGRVSPGGAGRTVVVERLRGGSWPEQTRVLTGAGGRYRALLAEPGVYRVRYRGEAGPAVRVPQSV